MEPALQEWINTRDWFATELSYYHIKKSRVTSSFHDPNRNSMTKTGMLLAAHRRSLPPSRSSTQVWRHGTPLKPLAPRCWNMNPWTGPFLYGVNVGIHIPAPWFAYGKEKIIIHQPFCMGVCFGVSMLHSSGQNNATNHHPNRHCYGWYKPFPSGCCILVLPTSRCISSIIANIFPTIYLIKIINMWLNTLIHPQIHHHKSIGSISLRFPVMDGKHGIVMIALNTNLIIKWAVFKTSLSLLWILVDLFRDSSIRLW